jgi:drug/metabolite transporter (DMT)-like permease
MVLSAVCCLALGGVFVRLSQTGPVASGAYRSLIAVPMLFGLAQAASRRAAHDRGSPKPAARRITRRDYLIIACGGVFLACDLCLWNISFLYTTLAESNLLANLVPFIIAPLCYLLYRDRIPVRLAWPALGALVGLYILVILGTRLNPGHLRGDGLALSTAVFYALFLVVAKGLRERYEAIRIMAWLSIVCGVTCFAVAAALGEKLLPRNAVGWLILIALAISSQILGQTLMAHAVKFLRLQLATIFVLFQPVAAAVYGLLIFGQRLDAVQLLGIAVLLVAIYWGKNIIETNDEATRTRPE